MRHPPRGPQGIDLLPSVVIQKRMLDLILTVVLQAGVVLLVARLVPGVQLKGYGSALGVALVYGLLTWALKTLLVALAFPLVILTLGAFLLVINAFLLWLTDKLLSTLEIRGFGSLAFATLGITTGYMVVDSIVGIILR